VEAQAGPGQPAALCHALTDAARLAGQTTEPHWEVKLLLRASDVLDRCGDHDDAVLMQLGRLE